MYCPKCGTQNNEGTRFCRSCGANLSLVPQALTGSLPSEPSRRRQRHSPQAAISLTEGITKAFIGVGFMIAALLLWLTRQWWGIFLLIPGFFMFGRGIAEIVGSKQMQAIPHAGTESLDPPSRTNEIRPHNTAPVIPPPSVTETTTRHLDNSDTTGKETG
ncbi:MAG TPA: zinc-ribbon domain-containing protein [Blastocatellia bacterium]|nr:zinc-ribbon domain-containing protein [Blastocatellia bacterium]